MNCRFVNVECLGSPQLKLINLLRHSGSDGYQFCTICNLLKKEIFFYKYIFTI